MPPSDPLFALFAPLFSDLAEDAWDNLHIYFPFPPGVCPVLIESEASQTQDWVDYIDALYLQEFLDSQTATTPRPERKHSLVPITHSPSSLDDPDSATVRISKGSVSSGSNC